MIYHNFKVYLHVQSDGLLRSSLSFYVNLKWILYCPQKKCEHWYVFSLREEMKPAEIIRRIQQQYGESCLQQDLWIDRFKNDRISIWTLFIADKNPTIFKTIYPFIDPAAI